MPCAEHTGFMLPPEEAAIAFHCKFGKRVGRARRRRDASRCRCVSKTTCLLRHEATKLAGLHLMLIINGSERIRQAKERRRQRCAPRSRQPAPKEQGSRLISVTDVRAQVEESLFRERPQQPTNRTLAARAKVPHGQCHESYTSIALK